MFDRERESSKGWVGKETSWERQQLCWLGKTSFHFLWLLGTLVGSWFIIKLPHAIFNVTHETGDSCVDAWKACDLTTIRIPITHDSHLHKASGCAAHERVAVVTLRRSRFNLKLGFNPWACLHNQIAQCSEVSTDIEIDHLSSHICWNLHHRGSFSL